MELCLSNLSLLSRSLIFSGSAILFSIYLNYEKIIIQKKVINSLTFNYLILFLIFLITIFPVNKIRQFESTDLIYIAKQKIEKSKISNNESTKNIDNTTEQEKIEKIVKKLEERGTSSNLVLSENFKRFLFVIKYRFVGLDSLAAVTSYPNKNLDLFLLALKDKFNPNDYGFYEKTFVRPYEQKEDLGKGFKRSSKRQYTVILPGIISFLSYPGSFLFLFFSCGAIYLICASIEVVALKFSYGCLVFSNFIGYIIGYRLMHFGYLPKQSYLLFGAILVTILLIKIFSLIIINKKDEINIK